MFKAMKRVWLVVGAMTMLSGISGFLTMEAKAAGSYDEAECVKYFEGNRKIKNDSNSNKYSCVDIKGLYSEWSSARLGTDEVKKKAIEKDIRDYESIVKLYKDFENGIYNGLCESVYDRADFEKKFGIKATRNVCDGIEACLTGKAREWRPRTRAYDDDVSCKDLLEDFAPNLKHNYSPEGKVIPPNEGGEIDNYSLCLDKTGVLGWIICPVLTAMRSAIEWAYEQIEDFFAINPSFLKTEGKDSIYGVWKGFRDFGNIIFVILIMVIIFSQLTGVGISNYGIKKLLPKIIVVAILVNISYYLAQLAVDVSNIIGYSAKSFLVSQVELSGSVVASDRGLGSAVVGVVMGAIVGVGLALIFLSIPLLGAALLASLTMLAMLGLRQGLAITLVVMSPLALACFLLPNTKKIFDKYWAATKAVLIAFPLSGIMIGAGQVAGALTINASNGSEIMVIMGFLMYFAPFFAVPTMLKKSLDAIGGIGSKISGFGFGKAKKQLNKAGEISKDRRKRVGAWAWTKKDANGNVKLRRGAAAFSRMAGSNIATKMLFGRAATNANKGAAAVNAKTAEEDKYLNQQAVNAQMTETNLKLRASIDENVLRDQLQNLQNQTELKIRTAEERQANPDVYAHEQAQALQEMQHKTEQMANIDVHRDRMMNTETQQIAALNKAQQRQANSAIYKYERAAEKEKLENAIYQANTIDKRGMDEYFDVRRGLTQDQMDVEVSDNRTIGEQQWIRDNRKAAALQKIKDESTNAVASMISQGIFQYKIGGTMRNFNINDTNALEELAHNTAEITDASGMVVNSGNTTVFKGIMKALAGRGKSSDFEAIQRIVTGEGVPSMGGSYLAAGNNLSNETMLAYSEVITSNAANKASHKGLFDQASSILGDGGYDAIKHDFENYKGKDLDKYDAYLLGSQKISNLKNILFRTRTAAPAKGTAEYVKFESEMRHLANIIRRAKRDQRISGKWDEEQATMMNDILAEAVKY